MSGMIEDKTEHKTEPVERTRDGAFFTLEQLRQELWKLDQEEFLMTVPMGGEEDGR